MAEKRIERDDIAAKDWAKNIEEGAKNAEKAVEMLEKSLKAVKQTAKTIKSGMTGTAPNNTKSVEELNRLAKQANQTARAKLQIDKQLVKEQARLAELNKRKKQRLRDEAILENKQLGTLQKLQVENRQLRREREKLNLSTEKGNKRLKEINATLDKNNKFIEKNSDKLKAQRLGIGRYSKALNGLKGSLLKVGSLFGVAFGGSALVRDSV